MKNDLTTSTASDQPATVTAADLLGVVDRLREIEANEMRFKNERPDKIYVSEGGKERSGWQCEQIINGARCAARQNQPHPITGSNVILTVAHLDHTPEHCSDDNLKAMCQRCHLRYDQHHHKACDKTADMFND